jgi:hypothetical protein
MLVEYAEEEMRRAGLYDKDSDYGGMIPEAVMKLVKVHAEEGHSGGSHELVMAIFKRVINFKPLTPITDDPSEWTEVSENLWQCRRDPSLFSSDAGKSYYDININDDKREIKQSSRKTEGAE